MKRHAYTLLSFFLTIFLFSCSDDENIEPDGDIDGDNEEATISENPPPDGDFDTQTIEGKLAFSCSPRACREGFLDPPKCVLPDDDLMNDGFSHEVCDDPEDCEEGQTCVQASPDWICVPEELPQWIGLYRFDRSCLWNLVAEHHTECAVLGAWMEGESLATLEQCRDEQQGGFCVDGHCVDTDPFWGKSLVDIAQCSKDGLTYLLLRDDNNWPPVFTAFSVNDDNLDDIHSVSEQNYVSGEQHSKFTCGPDGVLLWNSQLSVMQLIDGEFVDLLAIADIDEVSGSGYPEGVFDGIRFDQKDSNHIFIGIRGSYTYWTMEWQVDLGTFDISRFAATNWSLRVFPGSKANDWIIVDGAIAKWLRGGESFGTLFTLGDRESVLGVDADGGILTTTISRLFRYPLSSDSFPDAMDAGLPFPADFRGFVPAIRQFSHQIRNEQDRASLLLQYRATDNAGAWNIPEPAWE